MTKYIVGFVRCQLCGAYIHVELEVKPGHEDVEVPCPNDCYQDLEFDLSIADDEDD